MSDDVVNKSDLHDVRDTLMVEMRLGFKGTHDRQDLTNGRVNAAEIAAARHDVKIRNLEAEVFGRRDGDRRPVLVPAPVVVEAEQRGITRRDVAMFSAGGTALTALFLFLWKIVPLLKVGP